MTRDLRGEYQSNYQYAHDYWAPYTQAAMTYTLAASGYTWSHDERKMLSDEGREPIEFNITRRAIEFFSGYLRDNINSTVYAPVEGSDQATADQFTELSYYAWDKGKGFPTFLDSCDESFKAGMSLCGLQMDFSRDFIDGDISFYKRTFNSFYLDPTFESLDLRDCAFAITRDLVSPEYAKQLLPFIDDKAIEDAQYSFRDDKFLTFHPNFTNLSKDRKLIAYDQYYRRTTRSREFLVDKDSGFTRDITELEKDEKDRLKTGIARFDRERENYEIIGADPVDIPNVEIRTVERPYVELNIMLNGEPVYSGDDPTGIVETFPFVPIITYFEPSIWLSSQRVQGIASSEYSNQRQFNKRHMKIQDMFDTVIATGYKYIIGSIDDPDELKQSGQNRIIGIDPDSPAGINSVVELAGINVPQSLLEYAKVLDDLSISLANLTESSMGSDQGGNTQVSGRLAEVRIAQSLRSNRKIFDNIETSQQILGGLVLKCMQAKYSNGKVKRILNEDPTEQFREKGFEQYDAVIKEGVRSKSQKDAYYFELKELARDGLVDVPQSALVDALQMSGLDDLKEHIEQQQQQQAEQQKKVDAQERMALELANSQKISNLALSKEREARVIADIGLAQERQSEASSNLADAVLARSKAIVELSTLEDDHIMRVLEFVQNFQLQEQSLQNKEADETLAIADMIDQKEEQKQAIETQPQDQAAPQPMQQEQPPIL